MPNIAIDEPAAFQLHTPSSIDEALAMAADYEHNFAYLAGGCDLLDMLKRQWRTPDHVINLKRIKELDGIRQGDDAVSIGALTKLSALEHGDFEPGLQALVDGATRVATPQIRNVGTLGGNLLQDTRCPYYRGPFYCYRHGGITCDAHHGFNSEHAIFDADRCYTVTPSDMAPVVVALDATVRIRGPHSDDSVPAHRLFVSPSENITIMHRLQDNGEILVSIDIPRRAQRRSAFIKNAIRNAWDFSRASAAVALDLENGKASNVRIVLGGVAAVPWRCRDAERALEGKTLDQTVIDEVASAATAGASALQYNRYKIGLSRKLVRQALERVQNAA